MDRLTPLSAAFLQAEDVDEAASLAIGSFAVFEGPAPSFEELLQAIASRLSMVPRYRQRLRRVPFDLTPPAWVDDEEFDLANHVHQTALPQPGGDAQIADLIGQVMSWRMERERPLWEFWFVTGLTEGRWGVLSKVHHALADGVSGTDLYRLFLDLTPEPTTVPPDTWTPAPAEPGWRFAARAVGDLGGSPWRLASAGVTALRTPRRSAASLVRNVRGLASISGAALPVAGSSLVGPLHGGRHYAWTQADLDQLREVRSRLGGTVNDVALAAVSGGFRVLLLSRGERPSAHSLRSLVPVSTHRPDDVSEPDNRVSLLLPWLPVDVADPVERLELVRSRVRTLRERGEVEAGSSVMTTAELSPFPPVAAGVRLGFRFPQRHLATVTTNVPGPRQPLYCLGRQVVQMLPYVPIADRLRIGVAMFSYCSTLTFGLTGDLGSTPDLEVLAEGISASLAELVAAAQARA
ncbi:WS/DGAT/MGAT family O-acyltransferase [Nocardioides ferulae]|uniref:WS/DGAT/MGAT family O-acyltransferase n=1 Tax=Nocardioides ferulae TaxID=2340821 RepID=UPI000EABB4FD|nr:wax ester/triacylglycerol synthase family O-acyltransferase [Nocardioides ferulae]